MKGKAVLVTGGAGFIGSHTVEALLEAGARVVVYDNLSTGKIHNLPTSRALTVWRDDIRDAARIREAMASVDAVMHLAAQVSVRSSIEDPSNSVQHNVAGFINVLEAARLCGISRIVYASSAAVYGIPKVLPLDETSAVAPISPYGVEKLVNEHYADLFGRLYGLKCVGLRYFNVYGPRQDAKSPYAGVISRFADSLRDGRSLHIFGDGSQTRDFVYVKDVAHVNVVALSGDETGVVAVGTGRSVSLLDLVAALSRCAGRDAEVVHDAPVPGDIPQSSMSPEKLRVWLGWTPSTPLECGLKALLAA